MKITTIVALITLILSVVFPGMALLSKSKVEKIFLTAEQLIKSHFYSLVTFSLYISMLFTDICWIWNYFFKKEVLSWSFSLSLFILTFFISLITAHAISRFLVKFILKKHEKYKVSIEGIGFVYIIKMLNENTLLCSKEPNAEFIKGYDKYIIIKIDELNKRQLIKEKVTKPERNYWQIFLSDK